MTTERVPVCESCREAVQEESFGEIEWDDTEEVARDLGGDIADHYCNGAEMDYPCGCGCHR